jgi:hypothetical protein
VKSLGRGRGRITSAKKSGFINTILETLKLEKGLSCQKRVALFFREIAS